MLVVGSILFHQKNTDHMEYEITEGKNPENKMPIIEDEHGTYILNSKDLRAIEYIEKLVNIGINSFKVEGRTKSIYYVARVAQLYRQAIDDAVIGNKFDSNLLLKLEHLANRGYTAGFFDRHNTQYQNYNSGHSQSLKARYVGVVKDIINDYAVVDVKNKFTIGDTIEVISPFGNRIVTISEMFNMKDQRVDVAAGSGVIVKVPELSKHIGDLLACVYEST